MTKQKKYWFKRRRYGWGWTPVTWQGWLAIGFFGTAVLIAGARLPHEPKQPTFRELLIFCVVLSISIGSLVIIGYAKGPTPRWRWGAKPTDHPSEDI